MKGLWIAHFNAGPAHGNGIAVLRDGEILGGDFAHTWIGTYQEEGKQLYARVQVAPYNESHNGESVGPERPVMVTLTGERRAEDVTLNGHADDNEVQVTIEMHQAA